MTWTCSCGETFKAWATAQRHANESGHYRITQTLERRKPAR